MSANRKSRKPHRPRAVIIPLGIKKIVKLEMPGQVGLLALGKDWLDINHIRDIGAHASLVERVAKATGNDDIESKARKVIAIAIACEDRFERTGRAGTTGDEMHTLREIVTETLAWLNEQPNRLIHSESMALLRIFDKSNSEVNL